MEPWGWGCGGEGGGGGGGVVVVGGEGGPKVSPRDPLEHCCWCVRWYSVPSSYLLTLRRASRELKRDQLSLSRAMLGLALSFTGSTITLD